MREKKNTFHITITNNEPGETLHDVDVCAIVGAFSDGARTGCVGLTSCNAFDLAETINGAEDVIQHLYSGHPEVERQRAYRSRYHNRC